MHTWKDYDTARVIFEDFKQTVYPIWPNEHWEYERAFEDYIAKQISIMVTPAEDECNICWLNTTYKGATMDCDCSVCHNCKFPYEIVMWRYNRCACSFEPIDTEEQNYLEKLGVRKIAEAEDKEIYKLWEVLKNIDDTCQNWYIRQWIPVALQLIHKILKKNYNAI